MTTVQLRIVKRERKKELNYAIVYVSDISGLDYMTYIYIYIYIYI